MIYYRVNKGEQESADLTVDGSNMGSTHILVYYSMHGDVKETKMFYHNLFPGSTL